MNPKWLDGIKGHHLDTKEAEKVIAKVNQAGEQHAKQHRRMLPTEEEMSKRFTR